MSKSPLQVIESVSMKVLMSAKTKPNGVSDTRWRMELKRRKQPTLIQEAVSPLRPIFLWGNDNGQ